MVSGYNMPTEDVDGLGKILVAKPKEDRDTPVA